MNTNLKNLIFGEELKVLQKIILSLRELILKDVKISLKRNSFGVMMISNLLNCPILDFNIGL